MKSFKTICATALIVLGISFAITASSKEEEMSTIPEGCEVMDDIEEYIMMGAQLGGGLVVVYSHVLMHSEGNAPIMKQMKGFSWLSQNLLLFG